MARNGSGVYQQPSGTSATSNTTISSAKYNQLMADFVSDMNAPRPISAGGTGGTTAALARQSLGVEIGVDVQSYDANLAGLSGLTAGPDLGVYFNDSNALTTFPITALSRTLLAETTEAGQRTALGLGTAAIVDVVDEDDLSTDSATRPPSQQSVKAYVDGLVATLSPLPFTSGPLSFPASAGSVSAAHGLTGAPVQLSAWLVCTTAENGYSVGEVHSLGGVMDGDGSRNYAVTADATNVSLRSDGNLFITSKTTNQAISADPTNWDLFLRAAH